MKQLHLVILIFISLNLSAQEVMSKIDTLYQSDFYKILPRKSVPISMNNYENNNTQKKIKDDFEKLLPSYLKEENPFLDNTIEHYNITVFIRMSMSYINYLESEQKYKESSVILEKNLSNLNAFMLYSNSFIDYLISLRSFQEVYTSIHKPREETISLLEKNPIPNKSIFFDKLEIERTLVISMIDSIKESEFIPLKQKDYETDDYNKIMAQVKSYAIKYTNEYFDKMTFSIKENPSKEEEKFNNYINQERNSLFTTWSKIKLFVHIMVAKLFHVFIGYNSHFDYMENYMGKILATTLVPRIGKYYAKHEDVERKYKQVLKSVTVPKI